MNCICCGEESNKISDIRVCFDCLEYGKEMEYYNTNERRIDNMESQEKLKIGIGTKETISLKPGIVKIVKVEVVDVGKEKKVGEKVSFEVKHPDKEEPITISQVKFIKADKVKVSGTWFNLDEDNKIVKGSALAVLMNKLGVESLEGFVGKEVETEQERENEGYLCIKAY